MKNKFILLSLAFLLSLNLSLMAQTTLSDGDFVNNQITGPGTYLVEAGKVYYFDGRLDVVWNISIEGPDASWIKDQTNPPVLVNVPNDAGAAQQFVEIGTGGNLTIKNLMISGRASNDAVTGDIIVNVSGNGYTADNVAFVDWQGRAFMNSGKGLDISVTNCVFVNGLGLGYSPWGGFPMRLNVSGENVTVENNTVVNSGRLLCNIGPFFNARIHEIHNTYVNSMKAGHEQRAFEMIQANNIYYNYDFLSSKVTDNVYDRHWTTWNDYFPLEGKLDSIALYLGQNLFFRQQEILDWFTTNGGDSITPGLLWEHARVDSIVSSDANYRIGTNYGGVDQAVFDPGFTTPPDNLTPQLQFLDEYWYADHRGTDWPDWRVPSPVTYDENQTPVLNWPPAFDLTYSDAWLQHAGTDNLPLGDLNWWPSAKADYVSNKATYIAQLRDSIENAKAIYVPGSPTPFYDPVTSIQAQNLQTPDKFYLGRNYPNPFNPTTTINFGLPEVSKVKFTVYTILGQKVFEVNDDNMSAGVHSVKFDASGYSSGIYVYTVKAVGVSGQKYSSYEKMTLLK